MTRFIKVNREGKRIGKSELRETLPSRLRITGTQFSSVLVDTKTGRKFKSLDLSGRLTPIKPKGSAIGTKKFLRRGK